MSQSERGFFMPDNTLVGPERLYDDDSPITVGRQTYQVLDMVLSQKLPDTKYERDFLASNTIPYLKNAEKGLVASVERGEFYPEESRDFLEGGYLPSPAGNAEETTAFQVTGVVLGSLPEFVRTQKVPLYYARAGIFRPPTTPLSFLKRIRELEWEVHNIVTGETDSPPSNVNNSFVRMAFFFETIAKTPIRLSSRPHETAEIIKELKHQQEIHERRQINTLLEGIQMD